MNKIQSLVAICALFCGATASAQFTTGGKSTSTASLGANTDPYSRFTISYENTHLSCGGDLEDSFNGENSVGLNGFGLEYTHGFSVSKSLPMFVEAGIKLQFGQGSVSQDRKIYGYDVEEIQKYQQLSFVVPVNFTYKFAINDNMSVAPYLGINFKVHALGRYKGEMKFDDDDLQDAYEEEADEIEWINVFSDDEDNMGDKDYTWNRFQMGWQIGVGLNVKSFYIGLQYGTDFIPAYKYKKYSINSGTFAAKIGFNF